MMYKDHRSAQIIDFEEEFAADFMHIHQKWFESNFFKKHFFADPYDYTIISNPSKHIIAKGGQIFLAKFDEEIVGTVALIKRESDAYELSKMMVLEEYRGLKIGDELLIAAINYCKTQGVKTVWLESIRILKPALSLFRKYGFNEIPLGSNPHYARADVKMVFNP